MGQPKASLPFGASNLLERIVAELQKKFQEVIVVAAPADGIEIAGVRTIHDPVEYEGPVGAIERGMKIAANDVVFACSCDLPLLSAAVATELCRMLSGDAAVIPEVIRKLQPLHAAYDKAHTLAGLASMISSGEKRLTEIPRFIAARVIHEPQLRAIDPELRSFLNVNTPEEYQRALKLSGE